MPAPPKKRPWFQYHLSTLCVLMFVAAGLLWLNMGKDKFHLSPNRCWNGWPWSCRNMQGNLFAPSTWRAYYEYPQLAGDIFVALAILLAVAFLLESRIRRADRKP